ncbi:transcriptional regulator [Streptomyces sp. NPDC006967]|uniref:transcriptional regulator n=1 Tax=Streptomyces sp. NPDC006967 TaxID=3156906 RepID=UPI0033FC4285
MTSHQHRPAEDLAALLTRLLDQVPDRTQKDLAIEAGVRYPTLNAWMNRTRGTTRIETQTLWALIDALRRWGVEVQPNDVFEAAGRPVPGRAGEEREQRLLKLYRQLPEERQRDLVKDAEAMLRISRVS